MIGSALDAANGEAAVTFILNVYPSLAPEEALTFLYICAEDGVSLKTLSKRLGEGQSMVARSVATLEQTEPDGRGLVVLSASQEGELRRTVSLSEVGQALKNRMQSELSART